MLSIIIVILVGVIGFLFRYDPNTSKTPQNEITRFEWLGVGSDITLTGELRADGDIYTYTHSLQTQQYGLVWLKSRSISLNNFVWQVAIQWYISDIQGMLLIVEVTSVDALTSDVPHNDDQEELMIDKVWYYLWDAGIILNDPENKLNHIFNPSDRTIKGTINNKNFMLQYFLCSSVSSLTDCGMLRTNLETPIFTTLDDIKVYKFAETNRRFFDIEGRIGYYVDDINRTDLENIMNFVQPINTITLQWIFGEQSTKVCKDSTTNLLRVSDFSFVQEKEWFRFDVKWEDRYNSMINCRWRVKLSGDVFVPTLVNMTSSTETSNTTWNSETTWNSKTSNAINDNQQTSSVTPSPSSVKVSSDPELFFAEDGQQFALTPDKPLVFTSARWFVITYPSQKIAFEWSNIQQNFDVPWISCYAQTKVIAYANKELISEQPDLIIYECRIKANTNIPSDLRPIVVDDKTFLIKPLNPERSRFANALKINAVETE